MIRRSRGLLQKDVSLSLKEGNTKKSHASSVPDTFTCVSETRHFEVGISQQYYWIRMPIEKNMRFLIMVHKLLRHLRLLETVHY